jgi:hypothetical protein
MHGDHRSIRGARVSGDRLTIYEDGVERAMTADEAEAFAVIVEEQTAREWAYLRAERDARLAASDWTQLADAPADAAAWVKYRKALRDLPAKIKDPTAEVKWPEPPK